MGPAHEELHRQYVDELRSAIRAVSDWWAQLVEVTVEAKGSRIAAAAELERRWVAGPSAHPRILAVVSKYYILCDRLNTELRVTRRLVADEPPGFTYESTEISGESDDSFVPPGVFVGESLVTPATADVAKIIRYLTYWPIGVDDNGQFV